MTNTIHEPSVTYLAQISDKKTEKEFFNHNFNSSKKFMRIITLIFGIVFMLFLIPDIIYIDDKNNIPVIIIVRGLVLIAILFFYHFIDSTKSVNKKITFLTICEILVALATSFICLQYQNPVLLINFLDVILIIIAVFMIPNKMLNMILVSITTALSFIILSVIYSDSIMFKEYLAVVVYSIIVIVFCVISRLFIDYSKRKEYLTMLKIKHISITDFLTEVYNRNKLDEDLKTWSNYAQRFNSKFALIIFDIDDFKTVNDKFGHLVGDKVLIDLVNLVEKNIRKVDFLYRWGGEEFVLLLPNLECSKACELSDRIRKLICENDFGNDIKISCSFGVAEFNCNDDLNSIFDRADKQLYTAKNEGKNKVKCEKKSTAKV